MADLLTEAKREKARRLAAQQRVQDPEQMREELGESFSNLGQEWRKTLRGLGAGAAQAFTIGWADETIARLRSLAGDETYPKARRKVREGFKNIQEEAPGAFLIGGLATGAGIGVPVVGGLSRGLAGGQRLVGPVIGGSAYGAIAGAGEAPEVSDIPEYAQTGAAIGGATGITAPGAISGARGIVQALTAPARRIGNQDQRFVDEELARMVGDSGYTPAELQDRFDRFGPGTNVADVLGDTGGEELRQAMKTGRGPFIRRLERRQEGERDVVEREARAALGVSENVPATEQRMRQTRAARARPLYDQAYEVQVDMTPELQSFLETPAVKSAYRAAQVRARNLRDPLDPNQVNFRTLDEIKRSLDDRVNQLRRSRGTGDSQYRATRDLRDGFREYLTEINDPYAQALNAYAGDSAMLDALEDGRRIFQKGNQGYTSRELEDMWGSYTDSERQSFRMGVIDAVEGRMDAVNENANAARDFMTRGVQDKMDLVMSDAETFAGRMRGVMQRRATKSRAEGGSNTARDLIGAQERVQRGREMVNTARRAGDYRPGTVLDVMFDVATQVLRRQNVDATPEQRRMIAEALMSESPETLSRVLRRELVKDRRNMAANMWANRLARAMMGAAANPTVIQQAIGPE